MWDEDTKVLKYEWYFDKEISHFDKDMDKCNLIPISSDSDDMLLKNN